MTYGTISTAEWSQWMRTYIREVHSLQTVQIAGTKEHVDLEYQAVSASKLK